MGWVQYNNETGWGYVLKYVYELCKSTFHMFGLLCLQQAVHDNNGYTRPAVHEGSYNETQA